MSRIFCDYCGGTDATTFRKMPDGTTWCDECISVKCGACGNILKDGEEVYCNHPSCIEKRAENMFG